ncbi:MAG: hypothetical protein V7638_2708 [Acidobacteriota bacterium]
MRRTDWRYLHSRSTPNHSGRKFCNPQGPRKAAEFDRSSGRLAHPLPCASGQYRRGDLHDPLRVRDHSLFILLGDDCVMRLRRGGPVSRDEELLNDSEERDQLTSGNHVTAPVSIE